MKESKVNFGQEFGPNLLKICKKLVSNQNLCKLLVNTDLDPLNPTVHPDEINGLSLLNKNIKLVPLVKPDEQSTQSKVVVLFSEGSPGTNNLSDENITLLITVFCPFEEWLITGDSIRPFSIMTEIRKSLQDKRINGLGEIRYQGFSLSTLTDEMGTYVMEFGINAFN